MMIPVKEDKLDYVLGTLEELIHLNRNRINIMVLKHSSDNSESDKNNSESEKIPFDVSLLNEYGFYIEDKKQYTYGPPHWYIKGFIRDKMQPKDVYKLVNPKNEYCQFDIGVCGKTYSFFHNKSQGKIYRHYIIIECKNYDF